ncbi:hypothetical protein HUJ04_010268 [Dendroctonus ponderosae]|nr:hypothetical protein HUJ04_010268 [Dendroctonus ponderosae]
MKDATRTCKDATIFLCIGDGNITPRPIRASVGSTQNVYSYATGPSAHTSTDCIQHQIGNIGNRTSSGIRVSFNVDAIGRLRMNSKFLVIKYTYISCDNILFDKTYFHVHVPSMVSLVPLLRERVKVVSAGTVIPEMVKVVQLDTAVAIAE